MNKKLVNDNKAKEKFIMEFRELIDGNFMMILNGDKLKKRVDSGILSIDLNSPIIGGKLNPFGVLLLHKMKTYKRGELPEIIKKEIFELNGDEKRIKSFVKKYGFDSIEVPAVRNYFKELVKKARDKNSDESYKCKKKLNQLIVAMTHTDKKVRILSDVSIPDIVKHLEKIEEEANSFYPSVVEFCRDCGGKESSYSKCNERIGCKHVIEHIKKQFSDYKIKYMLTFNTPSEYIAETFRKKLGVDRTHGEKLLRYAKDMKQLR